MPDAAFVGSGTFVNEQAKDTSITPGWPGGSATAGHLAICQVAISDQGTGHTPPSFVETSLQGFRRLGPELQAIGFANTRSSTHRLYYKVLAGSDTAPTFQMTGGDGAGPIIGAVIATFSDVGVIRLSTGEVGDAGTITGTGITTKAANGLVAAFSTASDDGALSGQAFTDPASPTERYDHEVGFRMAVHLATGTRTAAGATGNFTATLDETDPWTVMVLALEETETFPSEAVADAFTYSDGELDTVSSGAWVDDTFNFANDGLTVASNQANNSSAVDERSYYDSAQAEANGEVAVTVATLPATNERVYLGYRIQAPATAGVDGYELTYERLAGADDFILYEVTNGSYTSILDVNHDVAAGDVIGIAYSGSSHEVYVKPSSGPRVHVGSITDGTHTAAGYVALGIKGTTARVDDFIAGPLEAGIEFAPTMNAELESTVQIVLNLPGELEASMTIAMAVDSLHFAGLATAGGEVSSLISSSATVGSATADAAAPTAQVTHSVAAGLATADGEAPTSIGSFLNPVGRNRYTEQLTGLAGVVGSRGSLGTPGSVS